MKKRKHGIINEPFENNVVKSIFVSCVSLITKLTVCYTYTKGKIFLFEFIPIDLTMQT
jgi:hypothetical protein